MSAPSTDRAAAGQVIDGLTAAGVVLDHVYNGEDNVPAATKADALTAIFEVDDSFLNVVLPSGETGWIRFVLGNDPEEVVCDHTVNLSDVIDPVTDRWY